MVRSVSRAAQSGTMFDGLRSADLRVDTLLVNELSLYEPCTSNHDKIQRITSDVIPWQPSSCTHGFVIFLMGSPSQRLGKAHTLDTLNLSQCALGIDRSKSFQLFAEMAFPPQSTTERLTLTLCVSQLSHQPGVDADVCQGTPSEVLLQWTTCE